METEFIADDPFIATHIKGPVSKQDFLHRANPFHITEWVATHRLLGVGEGFTDHRGKYHPTYKA